MAILQPKNPCHPVDRIPYRDRLPNSLRIGVRESSSRTCNPVFKEPARAPGAVRNCVHCTAPPLPDVDANCHAATVASRSKRKSTRETFGAGLQSWLYWDKPRGGGKPTYQVSGTFCAPGRLSRARNVALRLVIDHRLEHRILQYRDKAIDFSQPLSV